jgi:hypothetical protein
VIREKIHLYLPKISFPVRLIDFQDLTPPKIKRTPF